MVGGVLVFHDMSALRSKDAELRRLKRMIDLSQDAIIVTDSERRSRHDSFQPAQEVMDGKMPKCLADSYMTCSQPLRRKWKRRNSPFEMMAGGKAN